MGWANCGEDSQGRPIGYAHEATCDHPGCKRRIDQSISYACGRIHGEDETSCEKYFCEWHRHYGSDGRSRCIQCHEAGFIRTWTSALAEDEDQPTLYRVVAVRTPQDAEMGGEDGVFGSEQRVHRAEAEARAAAQRLAASVVYPYNRPASEAGYEYDVEPIESHHGEYDALAARLGD